MILEFSDEITIKNMPKKIMVFCHKFYDCNLAHVTKWVLANQNEPRRWRKIAFITKSKLYE
jgi:elongation factor P hydroxylase